MAPYDQFRAYGNVYAARFGEYRFFVPSLPAPLDALNTVYLHCDPEGRPYRFRDFKKEFERLEIMENLRSCGSLLRNHFWEVSFKKTEDRLRLLEARELVVKNRRCFVIDPYGKYIHVVLHWVPHDVTVKCIRKKLRRFGRVPPMEREPKPSEQLRTLLVSLTLKEGLSVDNFPHKISFKDGMASLAVVVGGTPTCLRCSRKGHLRKNCHAPQCGLCARVGHRDSECGNDNVVPAALAVEVADAQPGDASRVEAPVGAHNVESSQRTSPAASESVAESEAMDVTRDQAALDSSGEAGALRDVTADGDQVFAEGSSSLPEASVSAAKLQSQVTGVASTLVRSQTEEPLRDAFAGGDAMSVDDSLSALAASVSIAESPSEPMDLAYDAATPGTSSEVGHRLDVLAGGERVESSQSAQAASESSSEDAGSQSEAMNVFGEEAAPAHATKESTSKGTSHLRTHKPKKGKKKKRQKKR